MENFPPSAAAPKTYSQINADQSTSTAPRISQNTGAVMASPPTQSRRKYVRDIEGQTWVVYDTRPTKHGFDLLLGYPKDAKKGSPTVIPTAPLVSYWESHRTEFHVNFDLPASRPALTRLRVRLGFNVTTDRQESWNRPIDDLRRLPVCQFADLYNIPTSTAIRWRAYLLCSMRRGRAIPDDPAIHAVLKSNVGAQPLAQSLGVSPRYVYYLRRRLKLGYSCNPSHPCQKEPFPAKWNTPFVIETLRSGGTCVQVARTLGISPTHAQRLRALFRQHIEPAQKDIEIRN